MAEVYDEWTKVFKLLISIQAKLKVKYPDATKKEIGQMATKDNEYIKAKAQYQKLKEEGKTTKQPSRRGPNKKKRGKMEKKD